MKKPTLNSVFACVSVLVIASIVFMCLFFARREWQKAIGEIASKDNNTTERFVPSGFGRLRGLNEKFVIVTDATTGYEYMFVQGCGGVRLETRQMEKTNGD